MSGRRWSKFWWQDWQREPSLQMCSLAAQGLWMRLLCVAHDGDPYGHVTVNGAPPTMKQVARMASISEREAVALVQELEDAGVFSRTPQGVIYSRRMVKDKASSEKFAEYGRDGGNPALKGDKTHKVNGGGNGGGLTPGLIHQEAEAEAEAESKIQTTSGAVSAPWPDARAELWGVGLPILRGLTGKPEGPSRAMLGRLLKAARDDCPCVLRALQEAASLRPMDPIAWLTKAVGQPDDEARLLIAAGLTPNGHDIDGESTELFGRMLQ